jgi:hypothetical protein
LTANFSLCITIYFLSNLNFTLPFRIVHDLIAATFYILIQNAQSIKDTKDKLRKGQGKCGVAVVRVSGNRSMEALKKMTKMSKLEPRKALLRKIRDPETGEIIDNGLCLWFPGTH